MDYNDWEINLLEEAQLMKDNYNNPGLHHKNLLATLIRWASFKMPRNRRLI